MSISWSVMSLRISYSNGLTSEVAGLAVGLLIDFLPRLVKFVFASEAFRFQVLTLDISQRHGSKRKN